MKIDLHNHSYYSDGVYSPLKLIEIAKQEKVDIFALTDHDNVFGCEEIQKYAQKQQIKVISGMELSTKYKNEAVHIVCLFKNNAVPKEFLKFSYEKKEERKQRAIKMMHKIEEIYGLKIDMDELLRETEVITRANMCYHLAKHNNLTEVEAEPYVSSKSLAYIPSTEYPTKDGISFAKSCGCITILAHPCLLAKEDVLDIVKMGVDGIEIRYPKNKDGDEEYFTMLADKYHLLKSAGSDFHGDSGTKHAMIGTSTIDEELFKPICERLGLKWL